MKCTLCDKEFPNDISDYDLVMHFTEEHKKECGAMGKDILKAQKKKNQKINKGVQPIVNISNLKDNKNKLKDE